MDMLLKRENCCREQSLSGRKHSVDMFPTTGVIVDMFPHTDGILDMFTHTADIHSGVSGHVETLVLLSHGAVTVV